jgi:hypothetical protein
LISTRFNVRSAEQSLCRAANAHDIDHRGTISESMRLLVVTVLVLVAIAFQQSHPPSIPQTTAANKRDNAQQSGPDSALPTVSAKKAEAENKPNEHWKILTPDWLTAIGTVGSVVLALLLALWGEEITHWFVRPRLSLKARVRRPDAERTKRQKLSGQSAGTAYFFRLAVRNRGNAAARDVQVFLAGVERITKAGSEPVEQFTPMNLTWAYRGSSTLPTLLPDMPPTYCDLAHVDEPEPIGFAQSQKGMASLVLDVEFPANTLGHVLAAGTYHFHVILAAENCRPRNYRLEIIFSGNWYSTEEKMFDAGFKMRAL